MASNSKSSTVRSFGGAAFDLSSDSFRDWVNSVGKSILINVINN